MFRSAGQTSPPDIQRTSRCPLRTIHVDLYEMKISMTDDVSSKVKLEFD